MYKSSDYENDHRMDNCIIGEKNRKKGVEIAPGISVSEYKEIGLKINSTKEEWKRAVNIFDRRITCRFIDPINKLWNTNEDPWFSITALLCLLIETLAQFEAGKDDFSRCSKAQYTTFLDDHISVDFQSVFDGLSLSERFYKEIRCGILHSAQSGKSSILTIHNDYLVHYNQESGVFFVNVERLYDSLMKYYHEYVSSLIDFDDTSDTVRVRRENFITKMEFIANRNVTVNYEEDILSGAEERGYISKEGGESGSCNYQHMELNNAYYKLDRRLPEDLVKRTELLLNRIVANANCEIPLYSKGVFKYHVQYGALQIESGRGHCFSKGFGITPYLIVKALRYMPILCPSDLFNLPNKSYLFAILTYPAICSEENRVYFSKYHTELNELLFEMEKGKLFFGLWKKGSISQLDKYRKSVSNSLM